MPQTGPRRQNVAVRLLDDELALLRAIAHDSDASISDLVRDLMRLPPPARVLARRTTSELRADLAAARDLPPAPRALWALAVHRVLEARYPASVEEFLELYAARLAAHSGALSESARRTVQIDDDLEIVVGFGGADAVLRLAPRIPSQNRTLPSALLRGAVMPSVDELRDVLADTARRARRLADAPPA